VTALNRISPSPKSPDQHHQPGGQRGGGHAVERDGDEHCALLAAEVLIDSPPQRREKLVPFSALV
jgi:hypothetical protein